MSKTPTTDNDSELHRLHSLLANAINTLGEAGQLLTNLEIESKAKPLKLITDAIGTTFYLSTLIPDDPLGVDDPRDLLPDPELTPEERTRCEELSPVKVKAIDDALLANCTTKWQKAARVIADAMIATDFEGVPDFFYFERLRKLIDDGSLEYQGDLNRMRFSEVRLRSSDGD